MEEAVVHVSGVHLATAIEELDSSRVLGNTGILPASITAHGSSVQTPALAEGEQSSEEHSARTHVETAICLHRGRHRPHT